MKVLFITYHFLDENGGGSFASRAFVNAFSEIADSCMLLYPDRGKPIKGFIHSKCIPIGIRDKRTRLEKAINLFSGRINRFTHAINYKVKNFNPDFVVFDNSLCSAGLIEEIKRLKKRTITIHHNFMQEYYYGTKPYTGLMSPFLNLIFLNYLKKVERKSIQYSELNLTLTEQDIQLLYNNHNTNRTSKIMKLGCFEPEQTSLLSTSKALNNNNFHNHKLCFLITGSLNTFQSEFSIVTFLEDFYSDLLNIFPESKLIIAGKNPSNKMKSICNRFSTVCLIANPNNMQEIISLGDVYICPTSIGGGLKLRVMDGLKAGLPVITHIVSSRGYEDFKNANCMFIYDNKSTFKECLEKVILLIQSRKIKRDTILNIYESIFSYESGVERLRKILSTM